MIFDQLDDYQLEAVPIDTTAAYARGYTDRETGHEADPPLQAADRRQYLAGYRTAAGAATAGLLTAAGCTPAESAAYQSEQAARLEAERLTWEYRSRSTRRLDRGRKPITDSPLFGGPSQGEMF